MLPNRAKHHIYLINFNHPHLKIPDSCVGLFHERQRMDYECQKIQKAHEKGGKKKETCNKHCYYTF